MKTLYRIRDWDRHYEVAQTRKVSGGLNWVAIPTKHDGKGYKRLMRRVDGPAVFAAWVLIVQVAAKCSKRGTLADSEGPLDAEDLADKTDCPAAVFENALNVLSDKSIGWIETVGVVAGTHSDGSGVVEQYPTNKQTEQDITNKQLPPLPPAEAGGDDGEGEVSWQAVEVAMSAAQIRDLNGPLRSMQRHDRCSPATALKALAFAASKPGWWPPEAIATRLKNLRDGQDVSELALWLPPKGGPKPRPASNLPPPPRDPAAELREWEEERKRKGLPIDKPASRLRLLSAEGST